MRVHGLDAFQLELFLEFCERYVGVMATGVLGGLNLLLWVQQDQEQAHEKGPVLGCITCDNDNFWAWSLQTGPPH